VCVLDNSDEVMTSLGLTYCDLGRHEDALVLHEKVLESYRRLLPMDDPLIGNTHLFCGRLCGDECDSLRLKFSDKAMQNLAKTYSCLGREQEALVLKEMVLEFRSRVLPKDHPSSGDGHAIWFIKNTPIFYPRNGHEKSFRHIHNARETPRCAAASRKGGGAFSTCVIRGSSRHR
jgi:hypothetical protein